MKFDVFKWQEVKPNEEHKAPQGRLHLMCSEVAKVYVSAQGVEVLAQVGHETDIQSKEALTYRVEAPEGARVFVEVNRSVNNNTTGEVFTNMDRTPSESGTMLEVQRALRLFHLEQKTLRREIDSERQSLQRLRKTREPEVVIQPEPDPDPEPEPEPELNAEN